jgi:hypothetical protein
MKDQNNEERNRTFLAYCATGLASLLLILYAFTHAYLLTAVPNQREYAVLLRSTSPSLDDNDVSVFANVFM